MIGDGLVSIEMAAIAAIFILAARLVSLVRVTRATPKTHATLLESLDQHSSGALRASARRLGYRSPYAELALGLLRARDDADDPDAAIDTAKEHARRHAEHWVHRGQALDLVGLAVLGGLWLFGRQTLPPGFALWVEGGTVVFLLAGALLAGTLFTRSRLLGETSTALEELARALHARPSNNPPAPDEGRCPFCSSATLPQPATLLLDGCEEELEACVCSDCGKVVATIPSSLSDEPTF